MSDSKMLIVLVLLSSVLLILMVASALLGIRYMKYRSRPYLLAALILFIQAYGVTNILLTSIFSGQITKPFDEVLNPHHIISGYLPLLAMLAYFVEVKFPGWLNIKRFLIYVSPVIVLSSVMLLLFPQYTQIMTYESMLENIAKPDMLLRMGMMLLYCVYTALVVAAPYKWRQCLVCRKDMIIFQTILCCSVPAFIAGLLINCFPAIIVSFICIVSMDCYIAYIEFKVRIPLDEEASLFVSDSVLSDMKQSKEQFFDRPEVWMNPDITAVELAKMIGTNRTYLWKEIKSLGYSSFSDMINHKRVKYICARLESGFEGNISQLMFESGFRSRSAAGSEFKRIMGCTPSEY